MIFLADTSEDLTTVAEELKTGVGQLLTPLTRRAYEGGIYAIDNGAFSQFDRDRFLTMVERQRPFVDKCLFVTVPDVVGSARRTSEVFEYWADRIQGFPLAYAVQDGIEDISIPWRAIRAVFIGGTTAFKLSDQARQVLAAAKLMGKWVHIGRVNNPERWDRFAALGADSCDGTGISRYSHMRE